MDPKRGEYPDQLRNTPPTTNTTDGNMGDGRNVHADSGEMVATGDGRTSGSGGDGGAADPSASRSGGVSRRQFLTGLSAAAAGGAVIGGGAVFGFHKAGAFDGSGTDAKRAANDPTSPPDDESPIEAVAPELAGTVAFDGEHQAGIATPAQAHCNVISFTVRNGVDADGIRRLLTLWTEDARRITQGEAPLGDLEPEMNAAPAALTITCGFGRRLFDLIGKGGKAPSWLGALPPFSRDQLDERWNAGDLMLQICTDDPLMLAHATRHMVRSGIDYVAVHWVQQGFLPRGGAREGGAPRNLLGFKDGTVNPADDEEYSDLVWIDEGPAWMQGGTCMILRRIEFDMMDWERLDRASRENVFGRKVTTGAPLTGEKETDDPDYTARDEFGLPVIDPASHMARSTNPIGKPLEKLRRRAYSYDLPPEPGSESGTNSGLMFICFQKNPETQFIPIQRRLDEQDRLNDWITHIGSAMFFCPPGTTADQSSTTQDTYWGQGLIERA